VKRAAITRCLVEVSWRRWLSVSVLLIVTFLGTLMPVRARGTLTVPATGMPRTLTLYSLALHAYTRVNVLLPIDYARSRRRYPVLYLLHGFTNSYASWAADTDLVHFARPFAMIIVMPDGGNGWYINDANGGQRWEDYHIHQLIPFIDSHYRTIATRSGRAIAGLSMGGFGALSYAARHPDLFSAAASFSGALDVEHLPALGFGIAAAFGFQNTCHWHRESRPAGSGQRESGNRRGGGGPLSRIPAYGGGLPGSGYPADYPCLFARNA